MSCREAVWLVLSPLDTDFPCPLPSGFVLGWTDPTACCRFVYQTDMMEASLLSYSSRQEIWYKCIPAWPASCTHEWRFFSVKAKGDQWTMLFNLLQDLFWKQKRQAKPCWNILLKKGYKNRKSGILTDLLSCLVVSQSTLVSGGHKSDYWLKENTPCSPHTHLTNPPL